MANKNTILGSVSEKIDSLIKHYSRVKTENEFYDPSNKKLDLTQLIPPSEFAKILENASNMNFSSDVTMFEKFFDVSIGRASRYNDYEQLIYRIPEAAQALQIYVDSILAPNPGERENTIRYDHSYRSEHLFENSKVLIQKVFERTNFYNILPQIIYTSLLYGDCFIELDETYNGIRYILHTPKKASIVHDLNTDIELGLVVQAPNSKSKTLEMISKIYPTLKVNAPQSTIAIISDRVTLGDKSSENKNSFAQKQIEELVKDIMKTDGAEYKYLAPHKYVRFSVFYNNVYYPYGTSIFDPIRSVSKQLLLIESALAIYRATRTPIRTLWNVEVGSTPEDQIPRLINGIMNRVRRQKIINSENSASSIDSIPEMMSLEEDVWSPTVNGTPLLKVENIPSGDTTPYINDAEYFKKKIISGLGIPPAYLAEETGASTRALLTLEDIRFSRTIKKYQGDINSGLNDLVDACFILLDQSHLVGSLNISLPNPSSIEDNIRIDNISKRISIGRDLAENFPNIPKSWILKNVVGYTEDEINDMRDSIDKQSDDKLFSEQQPGNMGADGSIIETPEPSFGGSSESSDFDLDMDAGTEFDEDSEVDDIDFDTIDSPLGDIDLDVSEDFEIPDIDEDL